MSIKSLRGMNDIFTPEIFLWQRVEALLRSISAQFGYSEMRTPVLENTQLFKRSVGEGTDIVQKEMYSFDDKSGENVSLRPEGTAPIVRAVVEHNFLRENPVAKVYYLGPMFRHERPQKGRFRQFYQFGAELIGVAEASADVELISFVHLIFKKLNLDQKIKLHLSSIGCNTTDCRPKYLKNLTLELLKYENEVAEEFRPRIQTNPLRIFDQKDEKSRKVAEKLQKFSKNALCKECSEHISQVEKGLKDLGIPFTYDDSIVRGLDYYCRTAFEFITTDLGTQGTVCGGGRYDGLVESFGGPAAPAIGFGMGLERLSMLLENETQWTQTFETEILILTIGEKFNDLAGLLAYELRAAGVSVVYDLQSKSLKSQMKLADRYNVKYGIIFGDDEVKKQQLGLKDLKKQTQLEPIMIQQIETQLQKVLDRSFKFNFSSKLQSKLLGN